MADWYIDHGCTLYPSAYMSAPSGAGSFPQDGDGKASGTGATPAVSVATMDFATATAAAGATFGVHGATLTCVTSGATTTQFNAGTTGTLAANLATAINAATATPTVTTGGLASPYLKALVWASASGTVLTVYSRIASTSLNQAVNASCTLICGATANWTNPPATANFSGGVSGPWGLFFNTAPLTAAISATISTQGSYGGAVATMMGLAAAGDTIYVRTGRSGADIALDLTTLAFTVLFRAVGTVSAYLRFAFDKGIVWSGDNKTFTITKSGAVAQAILRLNGYTHLYGQTLDGALVTYGGVCNFKLNYTATDANGYGILLEAGSTYAARHSVVEGLETFDSALGAYAGPNVRLAFFGAVADSNRPVAYRNCKLGHMRRAGGASAWVNNGVYGGFIEAADCLLAYGGATTHTAALLTSGFSSAHGIKLIRPKFTGGGGGHHALFATQANPYALVLSIEDPIDLGQFIPSDSAAAFCGNVAGSAAVLSGLTDFGLGQFITSNSAGRAFLIDTPRRLLEWRPAGFPTTARSALPDGTPFSVRFSVASSSNYSGAVGPMSPAYGIKQIDTNTLGDQAAMTIVENFLLDSNFGGSAYTPNDAEWWIEGTYVSSVDGTTKAFSTRGAGTALSAGTETWSSYSFAPFAGSARSYSRWKITASLTDVKADTDVVVTLACAKQSSTAVEWCFIDPQFVLSVS